jgi:putative ATP-dependent endonuclease of OLD family
MYLHSLEISNFRCILQTKILFHEGVNTLIGENNTGKTATIDALRLSLALVSERRDLYLQTEDFHVDERGLRSRTVEFHLCFANPTIREQGIFIEMLAIPAGQEPEVQLHVRFTDEDDRIRRRYWGGEKEGQEVPPEVLDLLYVTHLGALRDAARDLAPSRGNRLSQLFLKLVESEDERKNFAETINGQVRQAPGWQELLTRGQEKIQLHLTEVALQEDNSQVAIDFVQTSFKRIVESLRLFVPLGSGDHPSPDAGGQPKLDVTRFEIAQNGLGYNNLIYTATVLGDLLERRQRQPDSYVALLIEEPEAHLHPQWQNVLFHYLNEIKLKGIQVFITSHSPTITAESKLDSLIFLARSGQNIVSLPLKSLALCPIHKSFLERFLDVTKCQLFFARSVMLVEGISEALLLPCFARRLGPKYHLGKNATEIVNIDGVAFEPFAKLFNSPRDDKRINVRCALITDDDRKDGADASARAMKALELEGGMLRVFLSNVTLEHELYKANDSLVTAAYAELHPLTDFASNGSLEERATSFVSKLDSNKDKGAFAQLLADKIEGGGDYEGFVVPPYLVRALSWVAKADEA